MIFLVGSISPGVRMQLDKVATYEVTCIGDLLERTHTVSVGQLLPHDPGWRVVLCSGAVASDVCLPFLSRKVV